MCIINVYIYKVFSRTVNATCVLIPQSYDTGADNEACCASISAAKQYTRDGTSQNDIAMTAFSQDDTLTSLGITSIFVHWSWPV